MSSVFATTLTPAEVRTRVEQAPKFNGQAQSNLVLVLPLAALICVAFPLWTFSVLPIFVVYLIFIFAPVQIMAYFQTHDVSKVSLQPVEKIPALQDREFDVVVYGVTGHSGLLLAEYLTMQYVRKGDFKIALAGRNAKKLEIARAKLARLSDPIALDFPLIIANSNDVKSLEAMCLRTKVVGTTVGPYLKYGEPLIRACARTGTGYCDLTGEAQFAELAAAKYDKLAVQTSARIVSFTGFDSVPADVGTATVVQKFKKKFGTPPARVDSVYTTTKGGIQGGTFDTIVNLMENGLPPALLNKPSQPPPKGKTSIVSPFVYYNSFADCWTIPFVMAIVNSRVVQWTNASMGHSKHFYYNEVMGMPTISSVLFNLSVCILGGPFLVMKFSRDLMLKFGLCPNPGEGPDRNTIRNGLLECKFYATSADGKQVETLCWQSVGDLGGFQTALYQGESCVALVKDAFRPGPKPTGAGLTVGMCIGTDVMLERLRNSGFLSIE